ncbi:MAG: ABC transporter ATP-binding protein [Clostridia bacterium]|nr:ABC transporter ATP-binding protein [Clostridia bacterium]MBQ4338219.1 ABC transporter ATP-binding protein [Clostridia bacterium]
MKKPGEYVELFRSMGAEWKWLLRFVSRYRLQIVLYVVIGLVGTAMGLGANVASKHLIDSVISHDSETIVRSAVIAVALGLTQIIVNAFISRVASVVGSRINSEIRGNIYEHIIFSRWESIRKYHSGELLNRIEGDVSTVSNSIVSFIPGVFTRSAQFIGCLAVVLWYDPTMAIFAFMSAPFLVLSSRVSAKMMRKYNKESREMNGKILSFFSESIQNLQTIKAFDITKRYAEQLKNSLQIYRKIRLDHDKFSIIMSLCLSVIGLVVTYTCYGWGVYRLWQGKITYGTMTLFLQLSGQLTSSFAALVALLPSSISIATAAGRIMEITDLPLEKHKDSEETEKMAESANEKGITVSCENLTYTYDDAKEPVIKDISFSVSPGETIAFVGPSGEGKTTILRLVLGLVEPDSGTMTMTDAESNKVNVSESTRRFCSYVPQGNAIFSGCIADNLRIVRPEATDEELENALRIADAWSFISELPDGMYTEISEKGVNFSEGQVQRMSIARAILRDAPVIVMDEATSALDAATEEKVLANIMKNYPNRTRIITTHRPSMLNYCTRVYRISKDGRLSEVEK